MKIRKEELFDTIDFLKKFKEKSIYELDFSDLTKTGEDLNDEEKDFIYWKSERLNTLEILELVIERIQSGNL